MKCLICRQVELVDGLTLIQLVRDEFKVVIHQVPARLCPGCGEAYVDEQVAENLLQQAVSLSETGVWEGVIEYNIPS